MSVKKTYRPKSDYEGCEITFPNPITGEAVDIAALDWPYTTESSVEMAHLDGHPWITDRPSRAFAGESSAAKASERPAAGEKPLSRMTKAELVSEADKRGVAHAIDDTMTKAEIVQTIEASHDTGGSE